MDILQYFTKRGSVPELLREDLIAQDHADYVQYLHEVYDEGKKPELTLNKTVTLNKRKAPKPKANILEMEDVYNRAGSNSPKRVNYRKKRLEKMKFTVLEPFDFEKRKRKTKIIERRLQQDLLKKEAEE